MCAKSLALYKILTEIAAKGPLTFARFMDLALYDRSAGYYASGRAKIGRSGDFFTNVSVGPIFGEILASQFREMWCRLGRPAQFALVEQGASDGGLAVDILSAIGGDMLQAVEYWIIEPFPVLRSLQERSLAPLRTKVHWVEDLGELPAFDGIHFSNELVDALPFHLIRSSGDQWKELCVAAIDDRLVLQVGEPGPPLADRLKGLPRRAEGTIAELRPLACDWIHALAKKMNSGFVLIIDYGFTREELLAPHRTEGTYCCYRAHRRDTRPLDDPGEKDISAHVDFTTLAESAVDAGFRIEGFTDQHHYVVGASQNLLRTLDHPPDAASQKSLRALNTLLHPESMGTQFHYLALSKGIDPASGLSSFRFAQDPQRQLFPSVA